jgi:glycine/D-amino acid oxidase-like deaminating enzyme
MTRGNSGKSASQVDHWRRQHARIEVVKLPCCLSNRCHDFWMRVAKDGTHLAGGKIQHPTAAGFVKEGTCCAHRHKAGEIGTVVQHVAICVSPKRAVGLNILHNLPRFEDTQDGRLGLS